MKDVTLARAPVFHIKFNGSSCTNITVTNLTIATDSSDSHDTDGIDVAGRNILIENSSISCGDDNIAASGNCSDIIVTNCAFGTGHGMSIGGNTSPGGVSNLLVINCNFTNTDNGIRLKADNSMGGPVQNCYYYNNFMTNMNNAAVIIYSYYTNVGFHQHHPGGRRWQTGFATELNPKLAKHRHQQPDRHSGQRHRGHHARTELPAPTSC